MDFRPRYLTQYLRFVLTIVLFLFQKELQYRTETVKVLHFAGFDSYPSGLESKLLSIPLYVKIVCFSSVQSDSMHHFTALN
jgi:hypothetical protein